MARAITTLFCLGLCGACGGSPPPISPATTPPPSSAESTVLVESDAGTSSSSNDDGGPADPTPSRPPLAREIRRPALALGAQHSCLLSVQGEVYCWGANRFGQIGHAAAMGYAEFATRPQRVGEGYVQIASGTWNTCALRDTGEVDCWGHGGFGQLGRPLADSPAPLRLEIDDVVEMAVGGGHVCLLRRDATLWCRGDNAMGQVGEASRVAQATFVQVGSADSVAAGRAHTCIRDGETLSCFGENLDAQLGGGQRSDASHLPLSVPLVAAADAQVALGGGHSCVLLDGHAHCWGRNDSFQLGRANASGEGATRFVPAPFDVGSVEELALGARFTCATAGGRAQCMGLGNHGQLGDGGRRLRRTWASVSRLRRVTHIAAGAEHVCAIASGSVHCWGAGRRGQLGDGHSEDRARPVRVVGIVRAQLEGE